ncbi:hypothetical protein ANN_24096 [Periplaneta americana]|uniref:Uncharacterized protein n=1 Tax=Periplaneta americana TaxID=6978 RepID=A0ABQ8S272_PERAM|nr:hypothetical protein ANN_24096 [Periplaneta americana]
MAGLCEGGNEPSGSLKASKKELRQPSHKGTGRNVAVSGETGLVGGSANPGPGIVIARKLRPSRDYCVKFGGRRALFRRLESVAVLGP